MDVIRKVFITMKYNGIHRRTVDLPFNKHCKRETFASESPFHLARRGPKHTWKTVTDAWNGYHSVPLREADRHLTTFITPYGRWRYARALQGFLSSTTAASMPSFLTLNWCVDDTIHYDSNAVL